MKSFKIFSFLLCVGTFPLGLSASTPPTDPGELAPLAVGDKVPAVTVQTANAEKVNLSEALQGQKSVLVFYRGGWCPFCTDQLQDLLTIEGDLQALGFHLYGISPDSPASLREGQEELDLPFTLLSDASMKAAQAFNLAFQVDENTHEQLLSYGIDIEAASGETHRLLPIPAVYLIDEEGTIQFAHYDTDYRQRLSAEKTLQAARQLTD
ncbi:MAG: AhpC/TSA family protein [Opitutales bacterium]|nr:AhpC/TSA family protein [Opitutales bacterium]MCH8539739.1 AhpC/TSA family protein [Opitutales bacterium]